MDYPRIHPDLTGLAAWLLLCFAAAGLGGLGSAGAAEFYGQLRQPVWGPPAWLFAPVWTVLYAMMGLSAWLVWRAQGPGLLSTTLFLFIVQLAVNAAWSWIFFVWNQGALSLIWIAGLWFLVAATMAAFHRVHRAAAWILAPYLLWISYALLLTAALWLMNPEFL